MKRTLITIIVPCYNAEEYIAECLDSIINQFYKNWEAICINDGSKDETEHILYSYALKDNRIKVFSQINGGVSIARNRGLEEAKGEYICFVDSDDTIEPTYLEVLLQLMLSEKIDLVSCGFVRNMQQYRDYKTRITHKVIKGFEYAIESIVNKKIHPQIWCMLFKKDIIDKYNLRFFSGCTRNEDWEFFMKYLVHTDNVSYTSMPLYHYRINSVSAMASFNEKSLTSLQAAYRTSIYYQINKNKATPYIANFALSRTLWKFLILSLLKHDKLLYEKIKKEYNPSCELKKLYYFPRFFEKITAYIFVKSEFVFRFIFNLLGYIYKY